MRYTSWDIATSGWAGAAEGETHCGAFMSGVSFLSCTRKHFPKSATVGEEDGEVQRKAPVGFLPVHRCHSPHSRLIQSHRHQMPWECQTQSLKRQWAQRRAHKQQHNNRTWRSTSRLKCKWWQDWEDGRFPEYSPSYVFKIEGSGVSSPVLCMEFSSPVGAWMAD